jgi:hypothetical protein
MGWSAWWPGTPSATLRLKVGYVLVPCLQNDSLQVKLLHRLHTKPVLPYASWVWQMLDGPICARRMLRAHRSPLGTSIPVLLSHCVSSDISVRQVMDGAAFLEPRLKRRPSLARCLPWLSRWLCGRAQASPMPRAKRGVLCINTLQTLQLQLRQSHSWSLGSFGPAMRRPGEVFWLALGARSSSHTHFTAEERHPRAKQSHLSHLQKPGGNQRSPILWVQFCEAILGARLPTPRSGSSSFILLCYWHLCKHRNGVVFHLEPWLPLISKLCRDDALLRQARLPPGYQHEAAMWVRCFPVNPCWIFFCIDSRVPFSFPT